VKVYWRKGGHDHLALARFMFDRQAESYGAPLENADAAWQEKDIAQFWLDEAWAALQFIHQRMQVNGGQIVSDKTLAAEEAQAPSRAESWTPPHLCSDGIHDFRRDDELSMTYCGKCDYWSPGD
jgi:hypothetical protein